MTGTHPRRTDRGPRSHSTTQTPTFNGPRRSHKATPIRTLKEANGNTNAVARITFIVISSFQFVKVRS
jgi:hypothetical protein